MYFGLWWVVVGGSRFILDGGVVAGLFWVVVGGGG